MDNLFFDTQYGRDGYLILEVFKLDDTGRDVTFIDRHIIDEDEDFNAAIAEYLSLNYADADVRQIESVPVDSESASWAFQA